MEREREEILINSGYASRYMRATLNSSHRGAGNQFCVHSILKLSGWYVHPVIRANKSSTRRFVCIYGNSSKKQMKVTGLVNSSILSLTFHIVCTFN